MAIASNPEPRVWLVGELRPLAATWLAVPLLGAAVPRPPRWPRIPKHGEYTPRSLPCHFARWVFAFREVVGHDRLRGDKTLRLITSWSASRDALVCAARSHSRCSGARAGARLIFFWRSEGLPLADLQCEREDECGRERARES